MSRVQPGASPPPALKVQVSPHGGMTQYQPEPRGKECSQQCHRPTALREPGGAGRLASLRVDDVACKRVFGRATAPRLVFQPGHSSPPVSMQPAPDHILPTVVDPGDLWHRVAAPAQKHHLRPERDSPHSLPAHSRQLLALCLAQSHPYHPQYLLRPLAAGSMPYLCLHA
jgi:hypothetical protein